MLRETSVRQLDEVTLWDLVIIGGGAAGLGCALAAAQKGYKTLLLEKGGFAGGTSGRSSKMIHGGVRYLKQGDLSMVHLSLREREHLLRTVPGLVKRQEFVIPVYTYADAVVYRAGMLLYDLLAGKRDSYFLSPRRVTEELDGIKSRGLKGGVVYGDGVFDDTRFAITLGYAADKAGATLINHAPVVGFGKNTKGKIASVQFLDKETGREHEAKCRCVINACGTFADKIRMTDNPTAPELQTISQGSHIILPLSFLGTRRITRGMMVPKTTDNRVLFCLPWHNKLLVGTTDTPISKPSDAPVPTHTEANFILQNCGAYLTKQPDEADILSAFAGQRALCGKGVATKDISREYHLDVSASGLVSILGGKWTTYRVTSSAAVNRAASFLGKNKQAGEKGGDRNNNSRNSRNGPAAAFLELENLSKKVHSENKEYAEPIHPKLPYSRGDIVRALRHEMARNLTDLLTRHTRSVMLDRLSTLECAPSLAHLMAKEMKRDAHWEQEQLKEFYKAAEEYRFPSQSSPGQPPAN